MKTALGMLLALAAWAQEGTPVNQVEGPPQTGYQYVLGYTGTNLISVCYAKSILAMGPRAATQAAITAISKASPAVVTSTGHGFDVSSRPTVTISGATGTGWTAVNGTFAATVVDANTFSLYSLAGVALDSSGFGTLAGTVIFTTTAPRKTMYEWAVKRLVYDGSNNLIWVGWLAGSSSLAARCSDAASTTLVQQ